MEFDAEPQPVQIKSGQLPRSAGQPQSIVQYMTRFALLVIVALAVGVATAMILPSYITRWTLIDMRVDDAAVAKGSCIDIRATLAALLGSAIDFRRFSAAQPHVRKTHPERQL